MAKDRLSSRWKMLRSFAKGTRRKKRERERETVLTVERRKAKWRDREKRRQIERKRGGWEGGRCLEWARQESERRTSNWNGLWERIPVFHSRYLRPSHLLWPPAPSSCSSASSASLFFLYPHLIFLHSLSSLVLSSFLSFSLSLSLSLSPFLLFSLSPSVFPSLPRGSFFRSDRRPLSPPRSHPSRTEAQHPPLDLESFYFAPPHSWVSARPPTRATDFPPYGDTADESIPRTLSNASLSLSLSSFFSFSWIPRILLWIFRSYAYFSIKPGD